MLTESHIGLANPTAPPQVYHRYFDQGHINAGPHHLRNSMNAAAGNYVSVDNSLPRGAVMRSWRPGGRSISSFALGAREERGALGGACPLLGEQPADGVQRGGQRLDRWGAGACVSGALG